MDTAKPSSTPAETKLHFLDYWRIIRIRKMVILAVFLLVVLTTTAVTFILPESWSSTVRIAVEKDISDITPLGFAQNSSQFDPFFIQTEFEVMQSQVLLTKIVNNPKLNLKEKWAAKLGTGEPLTDNQAILYLKSNLQISPVRNTSLIEIHFYSSDPAEAADLANAIAEAYKDYRLGRSNERLQTGAKGYSETMEDNEKKFHAQQVEVERLRGVLKVSDPDPASTGPSPTFSSAAVQQLMSEIARSEGEATQFKSKLDSLADLNKEKLRTVIQTVVEPDPVLSTLINELDSAEQNLLGIARTRTVEHPDYVSAKKVVDQYNAKIDQRVEGLLTGLRLRLDSDMAYITNQTTKVAEARRTDIEEAARTQPYWEAKNSLETLKQNRTILGVRALDINATMKHIKLNSGFKSGTVSKAITDDPSTNCTAVYEVTLSVH